MSLFITYCVFALATGISAVYWWLVPAIGAAKAKGVQNSFTQSPHFSMLVFGLLAALFAPVIFFQLMITSMHLRFYVKMMEIVSQPQ